MEFTLYRVNKIRLDGTEFVTALKTAIETWISGFFGNISA